MGKQYDLIAHDKGKWFGVQHNKLGHLVRFYNLPGPN